MYFPVLVFNNGFLLLPPQDSYYNIINNVFIYNISPGQAGTQLAVEGCGHKVGQGVGVA